MITKRTREYRANLNRRSFVLGGLQAFAFAGLTARLYYLQLIEGQQYDLLSERNKYNFRLLSPLRGRIYDAGGRLLAGNAEAYELSIIPDYAGDVEKMLRVLSVLIDLPDETIKRVLDEVADVPSFLPVSIRSDLTQREVAQLVVRNPELPGVNFARVERRIYPQGALASHVTGYVDRVTQDEIDAGRITRELASLSIGKSGAEKAFDPKLRGRPGREKVLINAFGKPIQTTIAEASISGRDIRIAPDMALQQVALNALRGGRNKPIARSDPRVLDAIEQDPELGATIPETEEFAYQDSKGRIVPAQTGSVIVMDIKTGAVRCLVSLPGFDPNIFSGNISTDEWRQLIDNPRRPLLHRALSGQYAPGSTFKMVVALAALEAGIINDKSTFSCPGHKRVGDQDFHCWKKSGHGTLNIVGAIEQSCDVFFYELGLRTGIERIAEMAERLGFGNQTGIDLPEEKSGLIPTKTWKEDKIGEPWALGETVNAAIGQGYLLATPMQMAVMTARLANGTEQVVPTLLEGQQRAKFKPLSIDPHALGIVRQGMRRVMTGASGTARRHDLDIKGVGLAGKTGTVQVRAISKSERASGVIDNADRIWKFRDHALFTGYAPHDAPRYSVTVIVEHGGGGSSVAAPIAKQTLSWFLKKESA